MSESPLRPSVESAPLRSSAVVESPWHKSPILFVATLLALVSAAIGVFVFLGKIEPTNIARAIPWALAGASVTFTLADYFYHRHMSLTRFKVLCVGLLSFIGHIVVAAVFVVMLGWLLFGAIGEAIDDWF